MIDLKTAAKRSGRNAGQLARVAADKWQSEGKAEMRRPDGGGKARWFVREDADPAFASVKFPEQMTQDLRQFTQAQRDEAFRRRDLLNEWDQFCKHGLAMGFDRVRLTNTFCERKTIEGKPVSLRTLYNWLKLYRSGGVAALIDGRGLTAKKQSGPDPFLAEVQRLYLSPRQPKLTVAMQMAEYTAREQGWTIRKYKACQRHIATLPAALIYKMRGGEDAYVAKAESYIERDYTTLNSNGAWNADHHQFDVIVNLGGGKLGRPWLSVFQDVRSRKIMGWTIVAHDPNTDVILSAFRSAVMQHGVPETLFLDNGKDYDSYALNGRTKADRWSKKTVRVELDAERSAGLFPQLGIDVRHVWPYHGQSKPIERWFGTLENHTVCWPTYCGRATHEKPHDLQLQIERKKAPKLADFVAWFGDWLSAHEASHKHQGDGMDGQTPDFVYAENLKTKRTAPQDLLDLLCLARVGPLKVGRNGVTWKGMNYGQHVLARLTDQEVMIRIDERDIRTVQVYTLKDQFICLAETNKKLPFVTPNQDLKIAIRQKMQERKTLKEFVAQRPRMADDLPDRMIRAAVARAEQEQKDNPTPPPVHSIKPIQHALADQLPAVQRAMERTSNTHRIAVGAESTSLVDVAKFMQDSRDEPADQFGGDGFAKLSAKFRNEDDYE